MVKYRELREKVKNLEKVEGCVKIEKPPIIHRGFPGQFNLSFTEYPWLVEHGKYLDFDHDYVFSTTPNCIRWADIFDERTKKSKLTGEDAWKYLGVFEMSDLIGMVSLARRTDALDLQRKQTKAIVDLLTSLGISKEQIYPSYSVGGPVVQLTQGKYDFNLDIPEDKIGKQVLLENGIPEGNLIADRSRDTLLSLKLPVEKEKGGVVVIPSPWEYRNEINVNAGTKDNPRFIDVGTLERFVWNPVYRNEKIIGLSESNDEVSIGAVGLERLCMVANGLQRVQDIDYIKPVYDALPKVENPVLVGESLRALHRIYSDIQRRGIEVRKKSSTGEKIKKLGSFVLDSGISQEKIKELLQINAEAQPWHPELAEAVDYAVSEIKEYAGRRR